MYQRVLFVNSCVAFPPNISLMVEYLLAFEALVAIFVIQLVLGLTFFPYPRFHFQRRLQHFLSGMLVLYCQRNFPEKEFYAFLLGGIFFTGGIHYVRLYIGFVQKLFIFFFGQILRGPEKSGNEIPGAVFFLFGNLISFILFPRNFCSLSIIAVAVGDPMAGICGVYFNSFTIIGKKTFAGTIFCGLSAGIAGLVFLDSRNPTIFVALALSSALAELFSFVDDNLTMPILFRMCFKLCLLVVPELNSIYMS